MEKRYTLTTDWQPGHMAAILSQPFIIPRHGEVVDRPIHYLAKKLAGYEAGWPLPPPENKPVWFGPFASYTATFLALTLTSSPITRLL